MIKSTLHDAVKNNDATFIKILLEHRADIEMEHKKFGTTPLDTAADRWDPGSA